jgi:hypothetical protein
VSDEVFAAFLYDYAQREAGKISDTETFFAILGQHSQADLSDLRADYFQP